MIRKKYHLLRKSEFKRFASIFSVVKCSAKILFWKISQNSQENIFDEVFLSQIASVLAWQWRYKGLYHKCFPLPANVFYTCHSQVLYKKAACKLTGKHLCWSLFLITLQSKKLQALLKANSPLIFFKICFVKTPLEKYCELWWLKH